VSSNGAILATGAGSDGTGVMCLTSSECYLSGTTISGRSSGDPTAPSFGVQVASTSRLTFTSGRVTGFDVGVQVWNNSMAFLSPDCDNVSIDSNGSTGVSCQRRGNR